MYTQAMKGVEHPWLWYVIIVHHTEVHKRHSCTLWICRVKWAIFKKLLIIDFLNWQKAIWNNCSRVLKFQHSARLWQVHTAKLHTNLWLLPHCRWMWHKYCWCPRKTTDTKNDHLLQNYTWVMQYREWTRKHTVALLLAVALILTLTIQLTNFSCKRCPIPCIKTHAHILYVQKLKVK